MQSGKGEDFREALGEAASSTASIKTEEPSKQQIIPEIPEAVDDFLRNFLWRAGLSRTLNCFEAEWYNSAQKLMTETLNIAKPGVFFIPDALTHRQLLQSELEMVHRETDLLRQKVLVAEESLTRMQRERDFHQLQHQTVTQDKNRLMVDLKQQEKHLESYKSAVRQLDEKYKAALRHKMLTNLKKEQIQSTSEEKPNLELLQIQKDKSIKRSNSAAKSPTQNTLRKLHQDTEFPVCTGLNSHPTQVNFEEWKSLSSFSLTCSIKAHELPISCIDLHPRKRILVSTSDDCSWRLWALPADGEKLQNLLFFLEPVTSLVPTKNYKLFTPGFPLLLQVGQMLVTGEGHSDWLHGCSFHPDGAKLATTSGDTMVRLWDFSRGLCVLTLSGHSQPTWGCSFHSCGYLLASCSADRTAKLWDPNTRHCRLTLRRHTASVNSVYFLPFSNLLLTCSADKTIAMWDSRLGVCTATFHGHQHPCNHTTFSLAGSMVASCDSGGIINLWDIRKPALAVAALDTGPSAANQVSFSPSGKTLAVASSDSRVRVLEVDSCKVSSLSGHSDGVQSVTFNHNGETLMSAGSDGVINIWS